MNFKQAVTSGFSNYATFNGRARRSEFWWWIIFEVLLGAVVGILDASPFDGQLSAILRLVLWLPSFAMKVRRLHDVDRSGWWLLIFPLALYWFCIAGTTGPNRFGADPRTLP